MIFIEFQTSLVSLNCIKSSLDFLKNLSDLIYPKCVATMHELHQTSLGYLKFKKNKNERQKLKKYKANQC